MCENPGDAPYCLVEEEAPGPCPAQIFANRNYQERILPEPLARENMGIGDVPPCSRYEDNFVRRIFTRGDDTRKHPGIGG